MTIHYDTFAQVDIRVGTIIAADPFPEARKPAYKLTIDFGPEIGAKRSSAQLTANYELDALVGRQVAAVINFAPRQIGPFISEVLVLGFSDAAGAVVLVVPDKPVTNGSKIFCAFPTSAGEPGRVNRHAARFRAARRRHGCAPHRARSSAPARCRRSIDCATCRAG